MDNNSFHTKLTQSPVSDLIFRFFLWGAIGFVVSTFALYGQSMEAIAQYMDLVTKTSLKNLDVVGIFGIFLAVAALWFKNMEKVAGAAWKLGGTSNYTGMIVRRTAHDVLLSAFGIGATLSGLLLSLLFFVTGSVQEWLIFGLTITQFFLIVGVIGFINLVLRVDQSSTLVSWQQKLSPVPATLVHLGGGILLSVPIIL